MSARFIVALLVVALGGVGACSPRYTTRGAGATTDDRPVLRKTKYRAVFGLVGSANVDVAKVCGNGDALIAKTPSFYNYTIVGLFVFRTSIKVYCRDDEYRAQQVEKRRQRDEQLALLEAQRREREANQPAPPTPASEPAPSAAPSPEPASDDPQPASAPSRKSSNVQRSESIKVERKDTSPKRVVARTNEECLKHIPRVEDKNPMVANTLTDSKRKPCHKCIDQGKAFSIYGLHPLHSSCD